MEYRGEYYENTYGIYRRILYSCLNQHKMSLFQLVLLLNGYIEYYENTYGI